MCHPRGDLSTGLREGAGTGPQAAVLPESENLDSPALAATLIPGTLPMARMRTTGGEIGTAARGATTLPFRNFRFTAPRSNK